MDWQSSTGMYDHYAQPQTAEEEQEEDVEDFYGDDEDAKGGASEGDDAGDLLNSLLPMERIQPRKSKSSISTMSADEKKAENQRKADLLRAQLLAKRQGTPIKTASRTETPTKVNLPPPIHTPSGVHQDFQPQPPSDAGLSKVLSSDSLGLDSLITEARAAAEAKSAQINGHINSLQTPFTEHKQIEPPAPVQKVEPRPERAIPAIAAVNISTPKSTPARPSQLTDPYYADLTAWLEMTGYHDITYRDAKLKTFKERKSLEEEAARIAERLEKLRREEQAETEALRSSVAHPSSGPTSSIPPLPATMPSEDSMAIAAVAQKQMTNGIKRAHSPAPVEKVSRPRQEPIARPASGFRIRGANDSPTSPRATERRISYPDARRSSVDDRPRGRESRDPSLERRQRYYSRDGEAPLPPPPTARGPPASRYEPDYSRDIPRAPPPPRYSGPGGTGSGYSSVNQRGGAYGYRGSAGLELSKGGISYFILKSWNSGNVEAAQRDCLWSTQVKNEDLLRQAFHSSRHVILFFSVNRSMAFQGYALMTSPPDPTLPKPPFAAKLNWPTSAAFSLRWLSTTPVHFRIVGHLKNELNPDEDGKARAVLVGKDGQEVTESAGRGLAEILDDVEEREMSGGGGGGERGRR